MDFNEVIIGFCASAEVFHIFIYVHVYSTQYIKRILNVFNNTV